MTMTMTLTMVMTTEMTFKSTPSIIDIDLLVDNISEALSRGELFNCSLVSKQWLMAFNPILWRKVDTKSMKYYSLLALDHHNHEVRSIIAHYEYVYSISQPFFPNLSILEFPYEIGPVIPIRTIVTFLKALPSVRSLKFGVSVMRVGEFEDLIFALMSHSNIDQIHLRGSLVGLSIPRLIHACHRFKSIKIESNNRVGWDRSDYRNWIQYQSINVRELSVPLEEYKGSEKVSSILGSCPMLERLELYNVGPCTIEDVCEYLPKCTLLTQLTVDGKITDNIGAKIIQAIGSGGEGKFGKIKLTSFNMRGCEILTGGLFLKTITEFFSRQLTTIKLGNMSTRCLAILANGLPNLESLTVSVLNGEGPILHRDSHIIYMTDSEKDRFCDMNYLQSCWTCIGLKHLEIIICISDYLGNGGKIRKDSFSDQDTEYVFTQIGLLHQLQELSIISGIVLLDTYLTNLSKLKNLREFKTCDTQSQAIGESEANWMYEKWPRLRWVTARKASKEFIKPLQDNGVVFEK